MSETGDAGRGRLLYVEDDASIAAMTVEVLSETYDVDHASTGEEALRHALNGRFDVMVVDRRLPGMDGVEFIRAIRTARITTPILMLTAKTGTQDEAEALDTGADDFLAKPFSYVVLLARLRALLRRGSAERPAVLTAGDLSLDPAAHQVLRGPEPVDLTPRQFALLELLLRRKGQVLSKREILEHVWDFSFEGDPNIVEVYVGQLRRRIDQPFGRSALQTVRGAGYRLDPDGG